MNEIILFLIYIVTFLLVGYIAYKLGENRGYEQGRFENKIAAKKAAAQPAPVVNALNPVTIVAAPVLPVKPIYVDNKVHVITTPEPTPVPFKPTIVAEVVPKRETKSNVFYMKSLPKGLILKLTR